MLPHCSVLYYPLPGQFILLSKLNDSMTRFKSEWNERASMFSLRGGIIKPSITSLGNKAASVSTEVFSRLTVVTITDRVSIIVAKFFLL